MKDWTDRAYAGVSWVNPGPVEACRPFEQQIRIAKRPVHA